MKRVKFALILIPILLLTGCTSVDEYINSEILADSGVLQDENYIKYEEYKTTDKLDDEGNYIESTVTSSEKSGDIHVTFPTNNNLKVSYYSDSKCSNQINPSEYYCNPGQALYATVRLTDNVHSSMYEFAGFNMYSYDEENNRNLINSFDGTIDTVTEILIPSDSDRTEISLEPYGKYGTTVLSFNAYVSEDDGTKNDITGNWYVDDKECNADNKIEISPISSCIVSYQYDAEEYFYMSSEPECYYNNNEDGLVIFAQREPSDEVVDYSVELHNYIKVKLPITKDRTIEIDGEEQEYKVNSDLELNKLKYGDYVTIKTNSEWPELEQSQELLLMSTESLTGSYVYKLMVPEKGGEFTFDPSEYTFDHGTIEFKCFGSVVNSTRVLKKGSKIYYEQKNVDEGYWLPGGTHCIVVGEEEETKDRIRAIHFSPMVQVMVELKQPEYGGTIVYSMDGKNIYTSTISTYSGKKIDMVVTKWPGWICDIDKGQYTVTENSSQIAKIDGKEVGTLFKEDDWHKPDLNVILDSSIGENMLVKVDASGVLTDATKYVNKWKVGFDYTLVDKKKVGTERGITLSLTNSSIPAGKALKIFTEKVVKDQKNHEESIIYIDDVTKLKDPIEIYASNERATSDKIYTSINIDVSLVDINKFNKCTAMANTTLSVKNKDTMKELVAGEYIEDAQEVLVSISPVSGYYISGKNVENGYYQRSMKYSDYVDDIGEILSSHTAIKYCVITLDQSDSFATYAYELDGKTVSGTINAKIDQKLELKYTINDGQHKLSESQGGVPLVGWGSSDTVQSESIKITSSYDGKTITRKDFGINLKGE